MLAFVLTLVLVAVQAPDASPVTKELEQIEQQLATTWKAGDCEGWAAFIAPEWSVIHITGTIITRAQALEMCKGPQARIDTRIDDVSVRAFGDTAVVTGRNTVTAADPSAGTLLLRFTDVFVRRAGRWQVVASHATQIKP